MSSSWIRENTSHSDDGSAPNLLRKRSQPSGKITLDASPSRVAGQIGPLLAMASVILRCGTTLALAVGSSGVPASAALSAKPVNPYKTAISTANNAKLEDRLIAQDVTPCPQ